MLVRPQRAYAYQGCRAIPLMYHLLAYAYLMLVGYRLIVRQSAFPLCLGVAYAFDELLPLLYQGLLGLSTTSPKIAFSAFAKASSSRVVSCFIGVDFSFFACVLSKSQ